MDQTINNDESPNVLEKAVKLDWQLSRCTNDIRNCDQCSSDLHVIVAIESRLEKLIDMLEAAYRNYVSGKAPHPDKVDDGQNGFVLGRLKLSPQDTGVLTRNLISDAMHRKVSVIRQLRQQTQRCAMQQEIMGSSQYDARPHIIFRQNMDACNELDAKLQALLGRVYSVIAQAKMSAGGPGGVDFNIPSTTGWPATSHRA
ncbi:uncharacterized protein PgNI_11805 [Pyricularia grisea]|uniref:Uncharacterized protein n=1 Tax=Pyricularia grisea TaxID=148305 RepID=A0A6P8AN74_PYRGI|nr:uncharacterized protein PgNI_11805 [Pyricularia grisea]TLD03492.1 hypothetical protein PgNI_11805 [Pyricularia grisea]